MKTWHFEMTTVAIVLVTTLCATGRWNVGAEWVGAIAVLLTFGHASVSDRLAEHVAKTESITGEAVVECHRWAGRYWVGKELMWLVYFLLLQAYSALVGVAVFLVYPAWRAWYRKWSY
jgi:hypothetical protein